MSESFEAGGKLKLRPPKTKMRECREALERRGHRGERQAGRSSLVSILVEKLFFIRDRDGTRVREPFQGFHHNGTELFIRKNVVEGKHGRRGCKMRLVPFLQIDCSRSSPVVNQVSLIFLAKNKG